MVVVLPGVHVQALPTHAPSAPLAPPGATLISVLLFEPPVAGGELLSPPMFVGVPGAPVLCGALPVELLHAIAPHRKKPIQSEKCTIFIGCSPAHDSQPQHCVRSRGARRD